MRHTKKHTMIGRGLYETAIDFMRLQYRIVPYQLQSSNSGQKRILNLIRATGSTVVQGFVIPQIEESPGPPKPWALRHRTQTRLCHGGAPAAVDAGINVKCVIPRNQAPTSSAPSSGIPGSVRHRNQRPRALAWLRRPGLIPLLQRLRPTRSIRGPLLFCRAPSVDAAHGCRFTLAKFCPVMRPQSLHGRLFCRWIS